MATGLYPEDSITRRVNRENVLLLGGGRALLMQLAHPKVAAGVDEHSDFRTHPVRRLRRTVRMTMAIVFGDLKTAEAAAQSVNRVHGRVRGEKDAPRTLDLDLLMYDEVIRSESDPILPHPRMTEREFVLAPLAEVAPEVVHPKNGLRVREWLSLIRGHHRSQFRLDGFRALVTGATGGIGKATAMALARLGADVLVSARNDVAKMVVNIRQLGRRADAILGDLANNSDCDRCRLNSQHSKPLTDAPKTYAFKT